MAHKLMWFQGTAPFNPIRCDGKPEFVCPESKRIAAEYMRDVFTLTNVINPNIFYDSYGIESWQEKELANAQVGDYLWLTLVPPKHHILDVFVYNEATWTEDSSLLSMGGITLSLVTGTFKAADKDGKCEMQSEASQGSIIMPATTDAKEQFLRTEVDITNDPETWTGVGVKITALPSGKTLSDIIGKIVVGCHVFGYDAQTYM